MPAPMKYDAETQERAVRMYQDRIAEHGGSKASARRHVGELLDIAPATPAELDRSHRAKGFSERRDVGQRCRPR